jgi:hypothetical protein
METKDLQAGRIIPMRPITLLVAVAEPERWDKMPLI